ncbi:MAG TPA: protein translocase subunit SecD [Acidimicrobiales bacterium]|nr:protein translocase subunit SecD [Acidimicrobiales bacterium]
MRRKILFPLVSILLVAFGGLAATLAWGNSPELGLDLQGGVSVVLAPTGDASGEQLDQALSIIRERVDALGVAEPDITRQGDAIVVQLPGAKNRDRALELVGQTAELRFRPVLQEAPVPPDVLAEAQATADEAVGATTTTTPGETPAGGEGDAPAESTTTVPPATPDTSEGAIGLVEGESAAAVQQPTTTTTATPETTTTTAATDPAAEEPPVEGEEPPAEGQVPTLTPRDQDVPEATVTLAGVDGASVYALGPSLATGRIVSTAQADIQNGQWMVRLEMRGGADGIDKFNEIAALCYESAPDPEICPSGRLAVVLDSVVQSAPSISQASYTRDQITISGDFSESEAKDLALVLRYGSLPVELERQTVQTVSATLGEDSLRAGVVAGIAGLAVVALYMILYYRALGIVVVFGFGVWGALMYTVICWLGATQGLALTLAGVTGMIMSIGVTADSYVVFFERLKDDVRAGRTLRTSTERSFKRAFRTILAANMTSFIGAAVLWWLTVGSVRGFALFLGLSTALGVVVTWFYTRPTVIWLSSHRVFTEMPVLGVARGLSGRKSTTKTPSATAVSGGTGR